MTIEEFSARAKDKNTPWAQLLLQLRRVAPEDIRRLAKAEGPWPLWCGWAFFEEKPCEMS